MPDTITELQEFKDFPEDSRVRLEELDVKGDKTPDETTELNSLMIERGKVDREKVKHISSDVKSTKHELGQAKARAQELENENAELKKAQEARPAIPIPVIKETLEIDGKAYYTDQTLKSMVDSNQMTDNDAFTHQSDRNNAKTTLDVTNRIEAKTQKQNNDQVMQQDRMDVMAKHPEFNNTHPDHDPSNLLYKETLRIYNTGYNNNPKGLSMALSDARKILRMDEKNADITDDLNLLGPSVPPVTPVKGKEIPLNPEEEEAVERMWRNKINPNTGRLYTKPEYMAKGLKAKNERLEQRKARRIE